MSTFPQYSMPASPVLTPFSPEALGLAIAGQNNSLNMFVAVSAAWPTASLAIYVPFRLLTWEKARQLLFMVGATSSGNIDVGIYDSQKNRIISSGSTAMSATVNTPQELNITDTDLPPGDYLLAVAVDNNTGTIFRVANNDEITLPNVPIYEQASAFPLPATAAPVVSTLGTVIIPVIGIQFRSTF